MRRIPTEAIIVASLVISALSVALSITALVIHHH